MKLNFSWEESAWVPVPNCISTVINTDGVSPLDCILTDDGGQNFLDTLSWLDEGLNRIKSVKDASVDSAEWSRDAWGAELTKEQAKIYSLHDEEYFEILSIDSFAAALLAWRNFLQLEPKSKLPQEIEI
ncbi:DUF5376 family protein [Noviherbaspirillum sp. Root189]|uniref:DUF5376 family protein n=1 Tax=Noviherbaspirillum sp. Root189 TaxID=1736487 RepID=UPI00070EA55E|nr:DUF5376 family protein [Noviherbaspirillum sp. Root189]KRB76815.1 hypothetical protein ASE07_26275 [Noviherbaspirillum sp. Root189]